MDYVICINNDYRRYSLTKGRIYRLFGQSGIFLRIKDDRGRLQRCSSHRFRSVKKNKINELLFDFSVV